MSPDTATIVYSYFFVIAAVGAGIAMVARHTIQKHTEELKEQLHRINYALYNDGKTGLINKVDQLIENQQCIRIDVEILKAKAEQ
jgi:bifunctional ADP-heptose synthase (sugar kinase/adenylyltransferase)